MRTARRRVGRWRMRSSRRSGPACRRAGTGARDHPAWRCRARRAPSSAPPVRIRAGARTASARSARRRAPRRRRARAWGLSRPMSCPRAPEASSSASVRRSVPRRTHRRLHDERPGGTRGSPRTARGRHGPVAGVVVEQGAERAGRVKARRGPPVDGAVRVTSAADWPSDSSAWSRIGAGTRSGPVFGGLVGELQHVGQRLGDVDAGDEARGARRRNESDGECGGDPLCQAEGADQRLADRQAQTAAARLLLRPRRARRPPGSG